MIKNAVIIFLCLLIMLQIFSIIRKLIFKKNNIKIAGFAYDEKQDIFYSILHPWQRKYGYTKFYDDISLFIDLVIDAEPIKFHYKNYEYLIEFWKGQYGMTTGGEIGIYKRKIKKNLNNNFKLYKAIADKELFNMSFDLLKNQKTIINRKDRHWWLTGFILGEFSDPEDLMMKIKIDFDNSEMMRSFIDSLKTIGYSDKNFYSNKLSVFILFTKPFTKQVRNEYAWLAKTNQEYNKFLCTEFNKVTDGLSTTPERLKRLKEKDKNLYKQATKIGRSKFKKKLVLK